MTTLALAISCVALALSCRCAWKHRRRRDGLTDAGRGELVDHILRSSMGPGHQAITASASTPPEPRA